MPSEKTSGLTIKPSPNFPVATGRLCQKGLNALDHVLHSERILEPLVRASGGAKAVANRVLGPCVCRHC